MKRLVAMVLTALVVGAAMFWPAVFTGSSSADDTSDSATITDYRADFDVDDDGTLTAVETLTVNMPPARHGIFRFWDLQTLADSHIRLKPRDVKVTVDGEDATFDMSSEGRGRYRVAKIGDADVYLEMGEHVYEISYRIEDALFPGEDDEHTAFYWNLIPGGWAMAIDNAVLKVHLPEAAGPLRCGVGVGEDPDPCPAKGEGTQDIVVRAGPLPPQTPVTLKATMDMPTPERSTVPWSGRFDPVLGRSVVFAGVLLVLSLVSYVVGLVLALGSRESAPGLPVMYAPPEGIGPVQAAYVVNEAVPSQALTATLLYAAEQGLVKLTRTESSDWVVEGIGTHEQWAATDAVTLSVGQRLGVTGMGSTFAADGSVDSGQTLQQLGSQISAATSVWGHSAGLVSTSVAATLGRLLLAGAFITAALVFVFTPFDLSLLGLVPAAFVIGAVPLATTGAATRRTATGRDLWSRAGGFRRLLATPSSEARFDFSANREIYTAYIPWAVAFGCAEQWEQKYVTTMGEPAPHPSYLYGTGAYYASGGSFASELSSFESSVASSISAYQATQTSSSSSSGGGGGFSGGGGGGGGGGGSW